jgi:hypothetical protein
LRHIVNFSGGLSSWAAAKRVANMHGTRDMTLLFADTLIEDPDLYRFLKEASDEIGVPVTRIQDGRTPWQVFFDERFLGNSRVDPCSKILKRRLLDKWHSENCSPNDTVIYVGLRWDEGDRLPRFQSRMLPWNVEAPLYSPPYLMEVDLIAAAGQSGIEPPQLYKEKFPHNNCGGFCVKAGQAHFAHLLRVRPLTYAYHEKKEQEFRNFIGKDVSILRDRRGGSTKTLTLKELRERIEADQSIDENEWGGCGCAV